MKKFVSLQPQNIAFMRLNNDEKYVLYHLHTEGSIPDELQGIRKTFAVKTLADKGLVQARINYDEVIDCHLTQMGQFYIAGNPSLRNPVRWEVVMGITAISMAALSFFTLAATIALALLH